MIQIEIAKKEDFKEIASIYSEEFSKSPYNEPWTLDKAIRKIEIFSRYCDIWKITEEKAIMGFCVVNPNYWCPGEIAFGEEVAIKEEFQNQGIGTNLLKFIFEHYKKKGFKLFMGIQNKNFKLKNFYNKLGIKEDKNNIINMKEL